MYGSVSRAAPACGAYARASSISAAVPEALSFAPGPAPVSSRWAMTTIVRRDRPGFTATRFTNGTRPVTRHPSRERAPSGR